MKKVTIHEAKTNLSKLLLLVAKGEEILISRGPEPVAKIVPLTKKRVLGSYVGKCKVPDDFNKPLPKSVLKLFYK